MPHSDPVRRLQYARDYYQRHREKISEYDRKRRKDPAIRDVIRARQRRKYYTSKKMLETHKAKPCMDCGVQYHPYLMEFDHVPERGPKTFNLSDARYTTIENLLKEIAKCDVVCSNCHRKRTLARRGIDPEQLS